VRPYFNDKLFSLLLVYNIQQLLYDIVCVLVFHHYLQGRRAVGAYLQDLLDYPLFVSLVAIWSEGALNAFLDHIRGKLVLRQLENLAPEFMQHRDLVLWLPVLEYVLDNVVAVLILHQ